MSNLLPEKQKKSILSLYRKRFLAMCFILVAGLFAVSSLLIIPSLSLSKQSKQLLTDRRNSLAGQETNTITHTLAASINDINTRLNVFPASSINSPIIQNVINPILGAKIATVHITDFTYALSDSSVVGDARADIRISGVADTREALLTFAGRMRTLKGFSSVSVPIDSFIKDANVAFAITATVSLK